MYYSQWAKVFRASVVYNRFPCLLRSAVEFFWNNDSAVCINSSYDMSSFHKFSLFTDVVRERGKDIRKS